jgi:cell division protein FtsB
MIKESHKIAAALSSSSQSADQLQKQLINKNEEIENLMTENTKLISEIKSMKS